MLPFGTYLESYQLACRGPLPIATSLRGITVTILCTTVPMPPSPLFKKIKIWIRPYGQWLIKVLCHLHIYNRLRLNCPINVKNGQLNRNSQLKANKSFRISWAIYHYLNRPDFTLTQVLLLLCVLQQFRWNGVNFLACSFICICKRYYTWCKTLNACQSWILYFQFTFMKEDRVVPRILLCFSSISSTCVNLKQRDLLNWSMTSAKKAFGISRRLLYMH